MDYGDGFDPVDGLYWTQCQPLLLYRNVRRPFLHAIAATTRAIAATTVNTRDTNGTSAEVTAHLRRFVKYLHPEKAKAAAHDSKQRDRRTALAPQNSTTPNPNPNFCGGRITEYFVYANFCQRFGICGVAVGADHIRLAKWKPHH